MCSLCECDHPREPVPEGVTRRGVLAAGLTLAGVTAVARPGQAQAADDQHDEAPGDAATFRTDAPPAPPLTLTGARLLDPLTGEVTEDATIVFRRGIVARAGRGVRPGAGGRVVDVAGAFVLPGFLDAHVHASTVDAARRALAGGATTIRSAFTPYYQDVGVRALAAVGDQRVPRTLAAGVFVTPQLGDSILADPRLAPLARLPEGVQEPSALRYLVKVNLQRGVDAIKTRSTERAGVFEQDPRTQVYVLDQLRAVVGAAGRRHVLCHAHGDEGIRDATLAGVRSIEHGTFASEATLDLMARRGTYLTPTISALVDLAEPGGEYTDERLAPRGREMLAAMRRTVEMAAAKGVPIVTGTDTSYTAATRSTIAGEIRHLAAFGVSNLDALRAATTTPAAMVGRSRSLGRLARGYAADAVVVGGDPLADLAALDDLRMVVADGWVAREG